MFTGRFFLLMLVAYITGIGAGYSLGYRRGFGSAGKRLCRPSVAPNKDDFCDYPEDP